ncbi:MAG: hypothetical protein HKN47_22275 [Pirellulaceae bacterium]|nr:hypothetical protein [Pirellulaceae bacterium]
MSVIEVLICVAVVAAVTLIYWKLMTRRSKAWPKVSDYLDAEFTAESSLLPESLYRVEVSDTEIRHLHPDGGQEILAWDDLQSVVILTTDQGPMLPDLYWVLSSGQSNCMIAQGATGEKAMIERLQSLPGFDNETMIDAMSSITTQRFALWHR